MPCERRSEIPSEGDARRCSYEVHVAPCAGVGAAVVDRRSAAAVVATSSVVPLGPTSLVPSQ